MQKIALLMITLCLLGSCKKDLRSKTYTLREFNHSGISGSVTFKETSNKDITTVILDAQGLRTDTLYHTHLHLGMPGALTGTLIYFRELRTATGTVHREENWSETFDKALQSNTCFTMHNPYFFSNDSIGYVLAGNTGANAK
jgi:hypothetical protein